VEPNTHLAIDRRWCGTPVELGEGTAEVELETLPAMAADDRGLVHGGFVFGLADHAAMLAVNHPLVVLANAEVSFLAPVRVGEHLRAVAVVDGGEGKRREVACTVRGERGEVLRGRFDCVVPSRHVLEPRPSREESAAGAGGGGA
jgi:acyl-coenzyme A thioesterase PaaI-like protein